MPSYGYSLMCDRYANALLSQAARAVPTTT